MTHCKLLVASSAAKASGSLLKVFVAVQKELHQLQQHLLLVKHAAHQHGWSIVANWEACYMTKMLLLLLRAIVLMCAQHQGRMQQYLEQQTS